MTQCGLCPIGLLKRSLLLLCLLWHSQVPAQLDETGAAESFNSSGQAHHPTDEQMLLDRLYYVQGVLTRKLEARSTLGERIEAANEQDRADLRRQANDLSEDIRQLRTTLESIATGSADTSLFVLQPEPEDSNWQEDITLIAQPVIDSLKELTEKPRKLKELNDLIASSEQELDVARQALHNLQIAQNAQPVDELARSLARFKRTWQDRHDDALNAIEIAQFQIADLKGDQTLIQAAADALWRFARGRGLTLVLALLAASSVWFSLRFCLRGYRATIRRNSEPESRTRYRLAAYSVHALTGALIIVAVFVVFYQRGDVLLLGLLILLIVGLALGVRQLLPQYLREARLLLNVGPMRETERVIYGGIPWRVESINMTTILRNPELQGVLRIPLSEFHTTHSRPSSYDSWFPTSCGDVVLIERDQVFEVIAQNPDTVELRERGGQILSIPTADFYKQKLTNLTRSGSFGVTGIFGIDYQHQAISSTLIPRALRSAIRTALIESDLEPFVKDVSVELRQAGESSIDYWLFVTMQSKAAKSYIRIQRLMQGACIQVCTEQQWSIPFPHVSLVQKSAPEQRQAA